MKKILSLLIVGVLLLSVCAFDTYAKTAKEGKLSPQQIQGLKSLGFTDEDIKNAPDLLLAKYDGMSGKVVSTDTKYYKFTKTHNIANGEVNEKVEVVSMEEALKGAKEENERLKQNSSITPSATYDSTTNSWLRLSTLISKIDGKNEWNYVTSFEFLDGAAAGIDEYVSTGWSPNVSAVTNSECFYVTHEQRDAIWDAGGLWHWGPEHTETDYFYEANIKSAAGYGFNYNYTTSNCQLYNFRGTMSYRVEPIVSNIVKIDAYGDYAREHVSVAPSVTITNSGILSLSPSFGVSNADNTHADYPVSK